MTNPGYPEEGFNLGPVQQATAIFGDGSSGGGSVTGLNDLEQPQTEDFLKRLFVADNESIQNPLAAIFGTLRAGVSLPLAIIEAVVKKLLGMDDGETFFSVEHALSILDDAGLGGIADVVRDILAMLGIDGGGGNTPGSGGFDPLQAIRNFINNILNPNGVNTGNTPIPPHQLGSLAPGTSPNDLPDTFLFPNNLLGQGRWWVEPYGAVRTVRPGFMTVFILAGANDTALTTVEEEAAYIRTGITGAAQANLMTPLDLERMEFVYIRFTETIFEMGPGHATGKADLIAQIRMLPPGQKFAFIGTSEGASVCSDVYDELRTGILQSRRADFLGGVMMGNPRRQSGVTFTDPTYGTHPDPNPGTSGIALVRLENTEPLWWEMAIGDDPVTCVSNTSELGAVQRKYYELVHGTDSVGVFTAALSLLFPALAPSDADREALQIYTHLGDSGHVHYIDARPFQSLGDTRTFMQVAVDYINSLAPAEPPPPELHQLLGVPYPAEPGEVITAGAKAQWFNLPSFDGPAILVAVNCYDVDDEQIGTVVSEDAVIDNPDPSSDFEYEEFSGLFLMPPSTASVRPLIQVAEQVMTTGIVWFTEPVLQVDQKVDAAILGNISNIPIVPATNVGGSHGGFDMNDTLETLVNGLGSANGQDNLNNVSLSELFSMMQTTSENASTALAIANSLQVAADPTFQPPETQTYTTPGTYTYLIPAWAQTPGVLFDLVGIGGGHGSEPATSRSGKGGGPGTWNGVTVAYGTEIPNGTTQLTVIVGIFGDAEEAGADTIIELPSTTALLIATGGAIFATSPTGDNADNFSWAGKPYFGGSGVYINTPGAAPGGGAGGGSGRTGVNEFAPGQPGGPGMASITVRPA